MDSTCTLVQQDQIVVQPEQPWLTANGLPTPDEHLKRLAPSWSPETWERYLSWYETPRAESLVTSRKYDQICEEAAESVFANIQSSADDDLKIQVSGYLAGLTGQQRRVIELTFWEGRSERFVARELGISQVSVHGLKKRALNKISGLIKGAITSRTMRGEISPFSTDAGEVNDKKVLDLAIGNLPKAG